jgi:hypothetical protein
MVDNDNNRIQLSVNSEASNIHPSQQQQQQQQKIATTAPRCTKSKWNLTNTISSSLCKFLELLLATYRHYSTTVHQQQMESHQHHFLIIL